MSFRATPLQQLNERIATAAQALGELQRIQTTIAEGKREVSRLDTRIRSIKGVLRKEERDFTKFDRITVPALIAGVLGTRDRRRQEEYQQWLRVREMLLEVMAERDRQVARIQRLQDRMSELEDAPQLPEDALKRKEAWLRQYDRDAMGRLRYLDTGELATKAELAKIALRLANSRNATRATPVNRGSVAWNQLIVLQQLQRMKMKVLRQIDRERRLLLLDGAPHTEAVATA